MKKFVSSVPLFNGLPEKSLEEIVSIASLRRFKRRQMIFSEGDVGSGFYVVVNGRVKVFKLSSDGKEQILHIVDPGEPFGEVAVFAGKNFPANAEAMVATEVLFFSRNGFMEHITRDPSLAMNMLAVLSMRLRKFAKMIENLSLREVSGRLAAYLLYMSEKRNGSMEIELDLSKTQLAGLLGTIPETLSRIFSRMQKAGLITIDGHRITIKDFDGLENLVDEGKMF